MSYFFELRKCGTEEIVEVKSFELQILDQSMYNDTFPGLFSVVFAQLLVGFVRHLYCFKKALVTSLPAKCHPCHT